MHALLLTVIGFTIIGSLHCVCPNGWVRHDNACYLFSHDYEPWTGAMVCNIDLLVDCLGNKETMCKLLGGKLAEVETLEESLYLGAITTQQNENMWIGLSDVQEEGSWLWMSTLIPVSFTHWAHGEPNNDGGEGNCGTINHGTNGLWYDWHCKDPLTYICEMQDEQEPVVG